MDEGLPIAYEVLDEGVPVYPSDGELLGTVEHVVAAPAQDIFHGIVISAKVGRCFVAADQIASLYERGVDLVAAHCVERDRDGWRWPASSSAAAGRCHHLVQLVL
jgi:hypothetical protein